MDELEEMLAEVQRTVGVVAELLDGVGLTYVRLEPNVFGHGLAVSFGKDGYCVIGVMGGKDEPVKILSPVLKNVAKNPVPLLSVTNATTLDNPQAPVYVHNAEEGWDVLVGVRLPVGLFSSPSGTWPTWSAACPRRRPGLVNASPRPRCRASRCSGTVTTSPGSWSGRWSAIPRVPHRSVVRVKDFPRLDAAAHLSSGPPMQS